MVAHARTQPDDPDRQIANVAEHWPQPKPKGRPRKNAAPDTLPAFDEPERLPPRPCTVEQSADDAPHLYHPGEGVGHRQG